MRVFSTILTALTLAAHLVGGCCWHHAHAHTVKGTLMVCHHHPHGTHSHSDSDDPHPPSEPCEQDCPVVLDRKANVDSHVLADFLFAASQYVSSRCPPQSPLASRIAPRDQHPPSLRIHLRNGVLLI